MKSPGTSSKHWANPVTKQEGELLFLAYFRTPHEALHLASSEDGLHWQSLNDNKAITAAPVGNRSIRDPFIRQRNDGVFQLICTDSWSSPNILLAESPDLLHWHHWRAVNVMKGIKGTQNAWAPEFTFDEERGAYLVFWSSTTSHHKGHRIWCAYTKDFHVFSEAFLLLEPGFNVIDATHIVWQAKHYLIFKDERGENKVGTDFKAMRVAVSDKLTGPYSVQTNLVTPHLTEGPTVFRVNGSFIMLYDYFLEGKWGASESKDLLEWRTLSEVSVPNEARHGSIFVVPSRVFQSDGGNIVENSLGSTPLSNLLWTRK